MGPRHGSGTTTHATDALQLAMGHGEDVAWLQATTASSRSEKRWAGGV